MTKPHINKLLTSWTLLSVTSGALMTGACDRKRDASERVEERQGQLQAQPMNENPMREREGMEPARDMQPATDRAAMEPVKGMDPASDREPEQANSPGQATPLASAQLKGADGRGLEGTAKFYDSGNGIRIVAEIEDATPGKHGIHVHERGDCSDLAGKSMGEHFNPHQHQHALPAGELNRHLGDLGNIDVGPDGRGHLDLTVPHANLEENDAMSFLGKSLIIHTGEDKGEEAQPSGGAGAPIACGAIDKS